MISLDHSVIILLWDVETMGEVLTCLGEIVSGYSRLRILSTQPLWPWNSSSVPPKTGQSAPRSWVVFTFTWLEIPKFLLIGVFQDLCIWEESQENLQTETDNHMEHWSHHQAKMYQRDWQLCTLSSSHSPAELRTFGAPL